MIPNSLVVDKQTVSDKFNQYFFMVLVELIIAIA